MSRDLPIIIEAVELDSQQAAILDDLLGEYLARFDTERSDVRAALKAVDVDTLHDAWTPPDWSDLRRSWREVRAEALQIEEAADARAWLESQQTGHAARWRICSAPVLQRRRRSERTF